MSKKSESLPVITSRRGKSHALGAFEIRLGVLDDQRYSVRIRFDS